MSYTALSVQGAWVSGSEPALITPGFNLLSSMGLWIDAADASVTPPGADCYKKMVEPCVSLMVTPMVEEIC